MSSEEMEARHNLFNYLKDHEVGPTEIFTHVNMFNGVKYFFDKNEDEQNLVKYVTEAYKKNIFYSISEKPSKYSPLRFDIDFKSTFKKRIYTYELIETFVSEIMDVLEEITIGIEEINFICVLKEKPSPRPDPKFPELYKDGFHLEFPHYICSAIMMDKIIIPKVIKACEQRRIFESLPISHEDKTSVASKVIDSPIARKMWLMHGARKEPKSYRWDITKVYDHEVEEISLENAFDLPPSQSIQNHIINFLSVRNYDEDSCLEYHESVKEICKPKKCGRHIIRKLSDEKIAENIRYIKESGFMDMLSQDRADNYALWMEIGWILFCVTEGDHQGLEMWDDFSQKSVKYEEGKCEEEWDKMENRGKKIIHLRKVAQKDSPERYREWERQNVNGLIEKALEFDSPRDSDISEIIEFLYKGKFLYSPKGKDKGWFEFISPKWVFINDGLEIMSKIPREIERRFIDYDSLISEEKRDIDVDPERLDRLQKISNRIYKFRKKFGTDSFQKSVINQCKTRFKDGEFYKKKDKFRHLFAYNNGVLDLEICKFREGRPDDYITKSANIDYPLDASWNCSEVKQAQEIIKRIHVDREKRNYFYNAAATNLFGKNVFKKLIICTGKKDSGKSTCFKFLSYAFGEFFNKLPKSLYVGKGDAFDTSKARPDLVRVMDSRMVVTDEITKFETVSSGFVKLSTGGDSVYARDLYDGGDDHEQQFTTWIQCNEMFRMENEEALHQRLILLEYTSKFSDNAPKDINEQFKQCHFPADQEIEGKLRYLAPYLAWILSQIYFKLHRNKITPFEIPEKVTKFTHNFCEESDNFKQFIIECLEEVEYSKNDKTFDEKVCLEFNECFQEYQSWHNQAFPSMRVKTSSFVFRKEISKRIGKELEKQGKKTWWRGWKLQGFE